MTITRSRFQRALRWGIFAAAAAVVVGYAIWRSVAYLQGPEIDVLQPVDGATAPSTTVEVIGRAQRVSSISLNGSPISIDQSGGFRQTIVVFPGADFISLSATDQFGRSVSKTIEVYGTAALPQPFSSSSPAR
ncbi:MAG: hypothetical protein KGI69_03810 [Patescibacteria group bacterium]|nr:hypothetical protein [Patescibacteria group bacterium]